MSATEERVCGRTGKERLTKSQAKSLAKSDGKKRDRWQSHPAAGPLVAFSCDHCDKWHVGRRKPGK